MTDVVLSQISVLQRFTYLYRTKVRRTKVMKLFGGDEIFKSVQEVEMSTLIIAYIKNEKLFGRRKLFGFFFLSEILGLPKVFSVRKFSFSCHFIKIAEKHLENIVGLIKTTTTKKIHRVFLNCL